MASVFYKVCKGPCGRKLAVNEDNFYKKSDAYDGFRNKCRDCYKAERRKPRPPLI